MARPIPTVESLSEEYSRLWAEVKIRARKHATCAAAAKMVLAGKREYEVGRRAGQRADQASRRQRRMYVHSVGHVRGFQSSERDVAVEAVLNGRTPEPYP
jgi:hypothetical protein